MTIAVVCFGPIVTIAAVVLVGLLDPLIHPRPRNSTMDKPITEYAVRTTYQHGSSRIRPFVHHLADARHAYDHEVSLHGVEAVEFLTRQVRYTDWVPGQLPPKVMHRDDGGFCDPAPIPAKPLVDAGSIDTWEDQK